MPRKKLKAKRNRQRDGADAAGGGGIFDPARRSQLLRGGLRVGAACLVATGICLGLMRLEQNVHALDRYERGLTLQWVDLPDWLTLGENGHILDSLTRQAGLQREDRSLDAALAERIGHSLTESDVGWVKSVDRVVVRPDGVVSVRCRFRHPTAWVRHGGYCYLVDEERVRLPGRYDPGECRSGSLMMIEGVAAGPPNVGDLWRGADLRSGLKLVTLLAGEPFRHQIVDVIVANHGGREDRSRPHIELATDRRGSRVLWGRPPDEEFGKEITASRKIILLGTLYREWGRIDMNRAYVNIMTWPDKVAMPVAPPVHRSSRLLRG